jgi:hypothetical protein
LGCCLCCRSEFVFVVLVGPPKLVVCFVSLVGEVCVHELPKEQSASSLVATSRTF